MITSYTFLLLVANVVFLSIAQILLKKGTTVLGKINISQNGIFSLMSQVVQNGWLLGGIFLFVVSFLIYLVALSRTQLNVAQPFTVGASMILIVIASWVFLKEKLSLIQITGIVFIIVGIFLAMPRNQ